jgi:hypothetical protein
MTERTNPSELAIIVGSLMHFYALTDLDPEIRRAQFEMFWLPELCEFEPGIIRQACAEWQRRQVKECPTPGQLRAICAEFRANAEWRRGRALPKPAVAPEKWMADLWPDGMEARDAAIRANEERFRKAEQWRQEQAAAVAGKPAPAAPEPPRRDPPQWVVERDRQRAEAKEKALGRDKIDRMVDRYVADSIKRVPAEPDISRRPRHERHTGKPG